MGSPPNVWRTDILAYAEIGSQRFPIAYGETLYRLDDIPMAYIEVPLGRKVRNAKNSTDSPQTIDTTWLNNMPPLTICKVFLKCSPKGQKPNQTYGYQPNKFMMVFEGCVVTPWIKKVRGGSAVASITAMGQIMKLATAAPYTLTMQGPFAGGKGNINVRVGKSDEAAHNLTASLLANYSQPSLKVVDTIKKIFSTMVRETSPAKKNGNNTNADVAVERLWPTVGTRQLSFSGDPPPAHFSLINGGGGAGGTDFQQNLDCNIARIMADVAMTDWAHSPQDGGGDLWNVLQKMSKLFMFAIVPTARSRDFIIPLAYGSSQEPFITIDPNEYWGVEFGRTFTMRDYAYVSECFLHSPLMAPTFVSGLSTDFSTPHVGYAALSVPEQFIGRTSFLECPSWAMPPHNLTPDFISKNGALPDRAAKDDPNNSPAPTPPGYWYDRRLGNAIAYHACSFQTFAHRVMSFSGRLRYDITPGCLCKIVHNDDIFIQKKIGTSPCYFGIMAEVRTKFGGTGEQSIAESVMTFSHVHNTEERKIWVDDTHSMYKEAYVGGALVDGVE